MNDLISRKEAIKAIEDLQDYYGFYNMTIYDAINKLKNLPPTQPERKTGKWVHGREMAREMVGDAITAIFYEGWQCSECKYIVEKEREPLWKFCPNCGAKMED